jgi:AcrR family transcriptional regulator
MSQSKQDQRKNQILDAALEVIVSKGYEGSSMADIVKKSKMSKGAIYWYFQSKKEVYLALVNHWVLFYSPTLNHIVEEKIIIKGVESKEFKDVDTKIAALSIMVNIESTIWFTLFENHGMSATKYMTTITDFILAGLTK